MFWIEINCIPCIVVNDDFYMCSRIIAMILLESIFGALLFPPYVVWIIEIERHRDLIKTLKNTVKYFEF